MIDQASYLFPAGDPGRLSFSASGLLVTLLSWAMSPHVKRLNLAFVVVDERLTDLSSRLTGNPHVTVLEVPLPDEATRGDYVKWIVGDRPLESFSDFTAPELAKLTAGITLTDIGVLLKTAMENGQRLDAKVFQQLKKTLIERHAGGLVEFVEPKQTLDLVVGQRGGQGAAPRGRRAAGRGGSTPPDGLPDLRAGRHGQDVPRRVLRRLGRRPLRQARNFRSKYVGETEGNLEQVLTVLRAMGPVVVVIDEADAALGDREVGGDSGTSSRVFSMIASQMGDTRYRGKLIWMLLTSRPDLLPIDLKRQGRAEVHLPLFYPGDEAELRAMFVSMARKLGTKLDDADIPSLPNVGQLSGADVEGIVGRAWRRSLLSGADRVTREALEEVLEQFMPSTQGLEKELQEVAAIIECTDRIFLPKEIQRRVDREGGRAELQQRLTELKGLVERL